MNLAIVLVDYNGLDDTRKCLESLANLTSTATIIVVDNASKVNVANALQHHFPNAQFLRSETNGGWAGGNNLGLHGALARGADLIALLNNDTTVTPDFAERLIDTATNHPQLSVFGPVIRYMAPPHEVQTEGVRFNTPHEPGFFQRVTVPLAAGQVTSVDIVNGCCLVLRREVAERIGAIDEDFFLIHEESDFCLRAQKAGFKLGVLGEALVFHKGSSTFAREGHRVQRYYDARNLLLLLRKHGGGAGRRGTWNGKLHAWRYAFSRYALEREKGFADSADAVLEGLYDASVRRFGPRRDGRRPGFKLFRRLIGLAWRLKSLGRKEQNPQ